jgi:hypothetical protein
MAAYLSPIFGAGAQLFDDQGNVLAGGLIYTYTAGTTAALATYTDSTEGTANANPVVLDATGRPPQEIWLTSGSTYKFIVTDSVGSTIGTYDNLTGINDVSAPSVSEWVATGLTPSYVDSVTFTVAGNNTATFSANRRLSISVTGGTCYAYVVSATFTTLTTVVIQPDSISLDSGISAVSVALLDSIHTSIPEQVAQYNNAVSVASAATTPIGAALSTNVTVTGTTTITAFDTMYEGMIKIVKFSGALTLTYNATSMILPGALDITTVAGDIAIFRSLGSGNWECVNYMVATNPAGTLPTGTRLPFQQTTVPTGWTKDTTAALNDCIMRIVTGTAGSGGTQAFSTFNGLTATGAYTLTTTDIPSHTHAQYISNLAGITASYGVSGTGTTYRYTNVSSGLTRTGPLDTGAAGGGGSHSHTLTHDITYYDFSIGVKD